MYVYLSVLTMSYLMSAISRVILNKSLNNNEYYNNIRSEKITTSTIMASLFILGSFTSLWVVAALRDNVGTDFLEYEYLYYQIKGLSFGSQISIEPFYFLLNKLLNILNLDSQWLFVTSGFIIYYLYYRVIIREASYFELSIYLFIILGFYFSTFNILRQWIACAIIFNSFLYLFKNKKIKFIISCIVAMLFHFTAVILMPLYFLIRIMRKEMTRILLVVLTLVASFFLNIILMAVNEGLIILNANPKYLKYLNELSISNAQGFLFPLICLIVYVLYLFYKNKLIETNTNFHYYINILIIGLAISILGQSLLIFARLHFYFLPILIIIIPNIIKCMGKETKIISYMFVMIFGLLFFLYQLEHNGGEPLPYNNIIFN